MGLRINNNIAALNSHRLLTSTSAKLDKNLQKLSSGFKINNAADKPAGLVISEQLRAQLSGIKQAIDNSQKASNMIGAAEGALEEMNSLLRSMRTLAIEAANDGAMDADQIAANQDEIDSAISSIDRIANTTKFANKKLLNGQQAYITSSVGGSTNTIRDMSVRGAQFGALSKIDVQINITGMASRAISTGVVGTASDNSIVRITGDSGSEVFSFASGMSETQVRASINALTANTGVFASTSNSLHSTEYGSEAFLQIESLQGTFALADQRDEGQSLVANVAGKQTATSGNYLNVASTFYNGSIEMSATAAAATYTFGIHESGMKFQIGSDTDPTEQSSLGIQNMHSSAIGRRNVSAGDTTSGFLSSLKSGDSHDLATDADSAVKIIDYAIGDVNRTRASLGAFQKNTLESTINSLRVYQENLTAAESRIRDTDFAAEMMEFTKNQILSQAGTAMMAQANMSSQTVLSLMA